MEEIKKLIEKFWNGSATTAESKKLHGELEANPEQWLVYSESSFKQELYSGANPLTEAESAEILQRLHQQMSIERETVSWEEESAILGWWSGSKRMIAAAAAVLIAVGIWVYSADQSQPGGVASDTAGKQVLKQIANHEKGVMTFTLADSSQVKLYPKSSVSFYEPFDSLARNISLAGKGSFKVAKDTLRRFSVYAGGLVTTALGTQFVITAPAEGNVEVKLLEGKVVVKSAPGSAFRIKDIYMQPGQNLLVDKRIRQVGITQFKENITGASIAEPAVAGNVPHAGLNFNRTPLDQVFYQLNEHYKTQIEFDKKEMEGLSFTGTLMPSDSLGIVLFVVCSTNDLVFREEADRVIVYKKK